MRKRWFDLECDRWITSERRRRASDRRREQAKLNLIADARKLWNCTDLGSPADYARHWELEGSRSGEDFTCWRVLPGGPFVFTGQRVADDPAPG